MKAKKITTELMVDDVDKTVEFYTEILGFTVTTSFPTPEPFFVIIENGPVSLMIYARERFSEEIPSFEKIKIGGSVALYIQVENIEQVYDEIYSKVKIIQKMHETDYGSKEFSFEDCNGYVLILNQK